MSNKFGMILDDEEQAEYLRIQAAQSKAMMEKAKANAAASALKNKEEEEKKVEAARIKAEQDALDWEKAKELVAQRQAEAAKKEENMIKSGGDAILMAIEKLAFAAAEAEAHAERVKKLEKVLGEEQAENMGRRARQKSKDLSDEIARMMEGNLESAFKQFDTDGSGTLDADELAAPRAKCSLCAPHRSDAANHSHVLRSICGTFRPCFITALRAPATSTSLDRRVGSRRLTRRSR